MTGWQTKWRYGTQPKRPMTGGAPGTALIRLGPALLLAALPLAGLLLVACAPDPGLAYGAYGLLDELAPAIQALRVLFALAGLALLVAGWKIYRFVVAVPGVLIGAVVGAGLGYAADESWLLAALGFLLGAAVGGSLALFLHDLAVFLIGALIGAVLLGLVSVALTDGDPSALVLIVGGLVGGIAFLALAKLWMVVLSAIVGAVLFGLAIEAGVGWMLLFCLAGIGLQYGLARALGESLPRPGRLGAKAGGAPAPPRSELAGSEEQPGLPAGAPAPPGTAPCGSWDRPTLPLAAPAPLPPEPTRPTDRPVLQPAASSPPRPGPAGLPTTAALVGVGPRGEMYRVVDGTLIGRGAGCELKLADRTVSRRHARLRYAQGAWFLQDEGSSGGTYVNGRRVVAARLNSGDRITIGKAKFEFRIG